MIFLGAVRMHFEIIILSRPYAWRVITYILYSVYTSFDYWTCNPFTYIIDQSIINELRGFSVLAYRSSSLDQQV